MTVIAWDGKTLAADRQATACGLRCSATKIFKMDCGIVGMVGDESHAKEIENWFRSGMHPDKWPVAKGDDSAYAVLVNETGLHTFFGPYGAKCEDAFMAFGSGRDYALAAMHCGKSAAEAVEVACVFDVYCGMGVDVLTL